MSQQDSILVIKLGALGDIFLSLRYFERIREIHPHARITMMTTAPFEALCRKNPAFDAVRIVKRWSAFDLPGWAGFAAFMRKNRFSLVYDVQSNDRTAIMRRLSPRQARDNWITFWHPLARQRRLTYARAVFDPGEQLDLRPRDLSWLTQEAAPLDVPAPFALLVPGCAPQHPYKRWPAAHFAAVAVHLHRQGITPVLIGGKAEREIMQTILRTAPQAVNLAEKTSHADIVKLAQHAAFAVGNDTGPMHMIALSGANTLSLFSGQTDPLRCAPHTPQARWLQDASIDAISPERVLDAISDWMKDTA